MIMLIAMMLAGSGADARHDFADCLKQADSKALTQKIDAEGFVTFARTNCANVEGPFQSSLISANVSHGMSKKAAASDAASQIGDYYSERLDNYKIEMEPMTPKATPASSPK